VTVDDQLVVPGDVVHSARTVGDTPARILGLALFADAPVQQFPSGITFEPLTLGRVTELLPTPVTASARRVAVTTGTPVTSDATDGPHIVNVESGPVTVTLRSGTGTVTHAANPFGEPELLTAGQPAQLATGDGVLLQLGAVLDVAGAGASVLDAGLSAGDQSLLLSYARDVSSGVTTELVGRYFTDSYLLHDAAWGQEVGLAGVAGLAKAGSTVFTDWSARIDEQLRQDDLIVGRWKLACTHQGSEVVIDGLTINRVRDGRMVEGWEAPDVNALLQQTGAAAASGDLDADGNDLTVIANRFVHDLWSDGDLTVIDKLFADDYTNHTPLRGQLPGRDGVKQFVSRWHTAFPDVNVTVDLLVVDGDRAAVRWTSRGTQLGGILGIAPTGQYVTLSGITLFTARSGVIVESWQQWDVQPLLAGH